MMNKTINILSIDTSCDDTSVAITSNLTKRLNLISSQVKLHKKYGGVYPTLAKQEHEKNLPILLKKALDFSKKYNIKLDAIAITYGPGLAPALEIGIKYAKQKALELNLPLIPVNHIKAHALSFLIQRPKKQQTDFSLDEQDLDIKFPFLSLVISGGHTTFIKVDSFYNLSILGETIDDALGEALDKVGRMLNLGYPAGPVLEKLAQKNTKPLIEFPLPMTKRKDFNLSFSGLKTSAKRKLENIELDKQNLFNFAASFQEACFNHITYKLEKILKQYSFEFITLGGGVCKNNALRKKIRKLAKKYNLKVKVPVCKKFCTDNAVMIGIVGFLNFKQNKIIYKKDFKNLDREPNLKI